MPLEKLRNATICLLTSADQAAIHIALDTFHTIFSEITTVRGDISESLHEEETFLDGGVAISPHLAARCLFDPIRTVQFLRGINAAIHEAILCFDQFLLFTTVSIFGSYGFKPYDCELSFPLRLHGLNQVASGSKIKFSYVFDGKPGLHYELVKSISE